MNVSSSSTYYSSTSTTDGTNTKTTESGHRYTKAAHTEPDGTTTVRTIRQDLGEPVVVEEHRYDQAGRELAVLPDARSGGMRKIEDIGDEEDEVDDDYKEEEEEEEEDEEDVDFERV
ncbi:uncharacterized protein BJX67DRAFT_349799 [Aspergillus lucknowensis]|uniref:Histone chaperone domain-containing protein n=1 Tax=Aspergillus lucknowensis TaxID=176173 RepID=A0ABR4LVJ1_9EURO